MKRILSLFFLGILLSSFFGGPWLARNNIDRTTLYTGPVPYLSWKSPNLDMIVPEKPMAAFGPVIKEAATGVDTSRFGIWYEDGRGNYSTDNKTRSLNSNSNGNPVYDPFMLASVLYENPRRPPGSSARVLHTNQMVDLNKSDQLTPGLGIKLFQSTKKVVSGDPMVFAISYRVNVPRGSGIIKRILLKYNQKGAEVPQVFTPLGAKDSMDIPVFQQLPDTCVLNSNPIPAVRTFASEICTALTAGSRPDTTLKASVLTDNETAAGRSGDSWNGMWFNNAMAISLPATDTLVHNIFITLTPGFDPALSKNNPQVFLEAVLQESAGDKNPSWKDKEVSRVQDAAADSHDPNDVSVTPECIPLPQKKTTLHYVLNFQNTGQGDADGVIVRFNAPAQADLNHIQVKSVSCGGNSFTAAGGFADMLTHHIEGQSIVFVVRGALLGNYVDDPAFNPKTKGNIVFDLDVLPEAEANKPTTLTANADIFFHSINGGVQDNNVSDNDISAKHYPAITKGFEQPVVTVKANVHYRKKCANCTSCDDPHKCWIYTYWWLILILIILLIFALWRLFRKKRPKRNVP